MTSAPSPVWCRLLCAGSVALLLPLTGCSSAKRPLPLPVYNDAGAALAATKAAWELLPKGQEASPGAQLVWRATLRGLLVSLGQHGPPETWTGTQSIDGWTVTFAGSGDREAVIAPSTCDEIRPVLPKPLKRLTSRVETEGAGLPVVMVQRRSARRADPYLPLNGRRLPATLTAEFTGERKVTLAFHNTRKEDKAVVRGDQRPLASDLSAPIASAMAHSYFGRFAIRGLFLPDRFLDDAGIYTPEPYDPAKIPVVFVHGINSDPHIWGAAMNTIAGDPELRKRYQCWYYLYPTGNTIQGAAAGLRRSLRQARDYYDPKHESAAMDQMVLVGHSMGGLLSRMQVIDSGPDFYRAFFTVPPEQLPFSEENLKLIKSTLEFEHQPFVKRVVFICVPHRGSSVVDLSIMRNLTRLIQPTVIIRGLLNEMTGVARFAINPALYRFRNLGTRSTENLSPYNPLLPAMSSRPILAPFHNIIAVFSPLSRKKALNATTDGAVPYSSAWLPGAESTKVVSGFHSCTEYPAVCDEVARILRLHAVSLKQSSLQPASGYSTSAR